MLVPESVLWTAGSQMSATDFPWGDARNAQADRVRTWLEGHDVNTRGPAGWTLLHVVASADPITDAHVDLARHLIAQGADVKLTRDDRYTPLHVACRALGSASAAMCTTFLEAGAEVNVEAGSSSLSRTPISMVIQTFSLTLPSHARAVLAALVRGGSTLVCTSNICGQRLSSAAEQHLRLSAFAGPGGKDDPDFVACKRIIAEERGARAVRRHLLRLRSLTLRGRAKTEHRVMQFLVRNKNEIIKKVLAYRPCPNFDPDGPELFEQALEALRS